MNAHVLPAILIAVLVLAGGCSDPADRDGGRDAAAVTEDDGGTATDGVRDGDAEGGGDADAVEFPDLAPAAAESETGDALSDAFFTILMGIVSDGDGIEKRDEMMEVVRRVFLSEIEGDGEELPMRTEIAITDTVADVIDQTREYRAMTAGQALSDQQRTMIVQLARQYSTSARARAKDGVASVHQGVLLAAPSIETVDVPKGYTPVKWSTLAGFTYSEGMEFPDGVMALRGKKVALAGYMMSVGQFENIHEFLLVESGWTCCFGQSPDVNGVVLATIPEDEIGLDNIVAPIFITGVLDVGEEKEDGWVVSVYRIVCDDVQEID